MCPLLLVVQAWLCVYIVVRELLGVLADLEICTLSKVVCISLKLVHPLDCFVFVTNHYIVLLICGRFH